MLTPTEAWRRLEPHAGPLPSIQAPRRQAVGHVLAEDLTATVDIPSLDVSAMDGYAVGGETPPGSKLAVQTTVAAGQPPGVELAPGKAIRVMTGAPVPAGADRVIPIEATDGGEDTVSIEAGAAVGDHIRRHGEVLHRGEIILAAGEYISAGAGALIAAHGYATIPIVRAPSVAFLTTGDEIVPPEQRPEPGQLRDTHTDFLLGATRQLGLELRSLGIAPDDPDALRDALRPGLTADVLLVSGGVSAGAFDFVERALRELGCQRLFKGVAMQPGKPLLAARHSRGLVFGLPGNPGSVQVCYWLFVRPVLRRMMGLSDGFWHQAQHARLGSDLPAGRDRDRFLPATTVLDEGVLYAQPLHMQGSHDLRAFGRASALIRVAPEAPICHQGEECEILLID
jgi:molybdopterin molybdotransferase